MVKNPVTTVRLEQSSLNRGGGLDFQHGLSSIYDSVLSTLPKQINTQSLLHKVIFIGLD